MGRKVYEIRVKRTVEDVFVGYCDDSSTRSPESVKQSAEKDPQRKANQSINLASIDDIEIVVIAENLSKAEAKNLKKRRIEELMFEDTAILNTHGVDE